MADSERDDLRDRMLAISNDDFLTSAHFSQILCQPIPELSDVCATHINLMAIIAIFAKTASVRARDLQIRPPFRITSRYDEPMAPTAAPATVRQQVDRWAGAWLQSKFTRLLELRAIDPGPFNYPIAVFSEWRGKALYLCVRYRARTRKPEDDFVVRHTRMTATGFGRFDLAYFRHTERWFTAYRGLTAAECFHEIESNEIFWPTT